jgi:hypothetical protein
MGQETGEKGSVAVDSQPAMQSLTASYSSAA